MKKYIVVLLFLAGKCFGQDSSLASKRPAQIEQYCEVLASSKLFSTKVNIDIDYGEARNYWKDHRLKDDDGKLKKFNSVIDAMNYMSLQGWTYVSSLLIGNGGSYVYHYIFKKSFIKDDLNEGKS